MKSEQLRGKDKKKDDDVEEIEEFEEFEDRDDVVALLFDELFPLIFSGKLLLFGLGECWPGGQSGPPWPRRNFARAF